MKRIFLLMLVLVSGIASAQKSLNNYKYAIVPAKFSFLKKADEHKLNTYTKMFLEKYGFTVYFSDDILPVEVANDNCSKIYVDLIADNSIFVTNLEVVFKDCTNNILWKSGRGSSKVKQYKTAYQQALREAFNTFDTVGYVYEPNEKNPQSQVKPSAPVTTTPATPTPATEVPANSDPAASNMLFAQPIENGFQIIDTTPRVILRLKRTSLSDVFLAENDQTKGILFSKDGKWHFEFYSGNKIFSETMEIKF